MFGGPAFLIPSPDTQPQYPLEATSPGRPFAPLPSPVPEAPRFGPFLSLLASFPSLVSHQQQHSPDTFLSRRHSFQGLAISLQDLICRSGISSSGPLVFALVQMASRCKHGSFPQLWLLSWGKLILTPTSHPPPTSLALFLGPEVRAQVNTSACFFPQSQGF